MMKTLRINEIVSGTSTNADGLSLRLKLQPFFKSNEPVHLSFAESFAMSTSFFNSSFGELIDEFGIDKFKAIVKPTEITKSNYDLVKKYINMHTRQCSV